MKFFSRHWYFNSALFFWHFILIIVREPLFFSQPRFWAEEGTVFFKFAYTHSLFEMIMTPLVGYYTLFNIITSKLSVIVPLEKAPAITTYLSLLIQIIPAGIIVFTDFSLWNSKIKKTLLVGIITILTPLEIWMNTTNSHIIFGLIALLISISSKENMPIFQKWFYRFILFLGTLTGPASSFITPIFLLRLFRERTKEILIQTIIMVFCSLIQVYVVIYSALFNNKYSRFSNFDFFDFFEIWIRDSFGLLLQFENDTLVFCAFFISVYFIFLFLKNIERKEYQYLGIAFIIVSIFSILGSLGMKGSPRYSFIPTIILYLILINEFTSERNKLNLRSSFSFVLIWILITISVSNYNRNIVNFYAPFFPNWKQEVRNFKNNPDYKLKVHPHTYPININLNWIWEIDFDKK